MQGSSSYVSIKTLGLILTFAFSIYVVIEVFNVLASFFHLVAPFPVDLGDENMSAWLVAIGVLALLQIPLYLLCVIIFLIWLNRAYKNLDALGAKYLEFSSGWAVGYWFIPFVNLVRPFQVAREVWNQSDPDHDPQFGFTTSTGTPVLIGTWWAMWLLSNITGNLSGRMDMGSARGDEANIATILFAISSLFGALAAFLVLMVVRGITERQEQRHEKMGLAQTYAEPPPPPTFN